MSKVTEQVTSQEVEDNAPEELSSGDLAEANGGVSISPPIYTTPGGPGGPISIPVESV